MPLNNEKKSNHRLSPESIKSSKEFTYASQAASILKKKLAPLVFNSEGKKLHKLLQSVVIAILTTGPVALKGKRQLGHGNVGLLKGTELNQHTKFDSLAHFMFTRIEIEPTNGKVVVRVPAIASSDINWPEKAVQVVLRIRCLLIDPDKEGFAATVFETAPLISSVYGTLSKAKKALLKVGDTEGKVILVAAGISFIRTDGNGTEPYESYNRKHYAARILEAVFIKDGKVVVFKEQTKVKQVEVPSDTSIPEKSQWEDDEE
ncbi:hypothetical protein SAMN04487906_0499 [Zhouia amylolytica]|uniref:Uncharacterized protein n=1 Tax=Zhouia amylolytica TaxID=376730 RepID=A0A1I6PVK0_9FLAO|nr:hypothetical protein [Zhouia amylolytica]SFS44229.1 hypothetical protein SAMN04487906_0499 [Zhouia amylolytica]